MARNDRFTETFERFNANLLRVLGLSRTDTERDEILDNFRERLEKFARQSQQAPGQTRPQRPRPPSPAASSQVSTSVSTPAPSEAKAALPFDQFGDPAPEAGASAVLDVESTDPGPAGPTVRGADGGYGTFAVLQPRVSVPKVRRSSVRTGPNAARVDGASRGSTRGEGTREPPRRAKREVPERSVPKSVVSRRQDAELRVAQREARTPALRLVRTPGGLVVPDAPAPLVLPEVPLPPAPSLSDPSLSPTPAAERP